MRRSFNLFPSAYTPLPALNGQVKVFNRLADASADVRFSGTDLVEEIYNYGLLPGSTLQTTVASQGRRLESQLNGQAGLISAVLYNIGNKSDFRFLHDRSVPYGLFTVYAPTTLGSTNSIFKSFFGGQTNGIFLGLTSDLKLTVSIRQSDGTNSATFVNSSSVAPVMQLGVPAYLAYVNYGYQVAGNDIEIAINNDAPCITVAESGSSTYASVDPAENFSIGPYDGRCAWYYFLCVAWPGMSRAQIQQDVDNMKAWSKTNFSPWQ